MKHIFITTSIPYVNAEPHIGYALEVIQGDTLARHYRLTGNNVFFLIGTDENAIKNVESAEKQGLSPQELVDKNSQAFLALKPALNLTFDRFIRTTSDTHKKGAQEFWNRCKHDIYKKEYEGLYCVGCETFYKDQEYPDNICPLHNRKLETVSETNYFFALSRYQNIILEKIQNGEMRIFPEFKKEEVLNFIRKGLEDFSISRPKERTKNWGIPVPDDESQRMYVWFDALTNYITGLDFAGNGDLFKTFWLENADRFHIVGKDIIKFHAIYWIAMLLSANLPLPTKIFVHGFLTSGGKKISKTLGNVVDPFELVKTYGIDAVRYYLLREIPSLDDGDYSESRFTEVYNADLANGLGNLVARVLTLCEKNNVAFEMQEKKPELSNPLVENYQFNLALEELWKDIKDLDVKINAEQPWTKSKEDVAPLLIEYLKKIRGIAFRLQPFLPDTAEKIIKATQGQIKKIPSLFFRITNNK